MGDNVSFFHADDEVVGRNFPYLTDLHQEMALVLEYSNAGSNNKQNNRNDFVVLRL